MKKISKVSLSFFLLTNFLVFGQNKNVFDVARSGSVTDMQELIRLYKDTINTVNKNGFTPLLLACYRGNVKVADFLIEKVADINSLSPEGTALTATVYRGDIYLTQKLLQKGANPNLVSETGITPLMYAVQIQNKEIVELLLQYKADITKTDTQGQSAFEYAIFSKNKEIINLLKN